MTKGEVNQVFDWLEENMNKLGILYFKIDSNNITAYLKTTRKSFAQFYPKQILKVIRNDFGEVKDEKSRNSSC